MAWHGVFVEGEGHSDGVHISIDLLSSRGRDHKSHVGKGISDHLIQRL